MRGRTVLLGTILLALGGWVLLVPSESQVQTSMVKSRPRVRTPVRYTGLPKPRMQLVSLASVEPTLAPLESSFLARATEHIESDPNRRNMRDFHALNGSVVHTPFGATVTYQVTQNGRPILGMRVEVELDRKMNVKSTRWNYRPIDTVSVESPDSEGVDEIRMPAGFTPRPDGGESSRVIFENFAEGRGENALAVPGYNSIGSPVTLLLRVSDGALLGVEMGRSERR